MQRSCERCPRAHARAGTRTVEVDGRLAAFALTTSISRKMALVAAPSEFRRLAALAHEALDRPGVDEFPRLLARMRHLRVAFRDMNHFDTEFLGKRGPGSAGIRHFSAATKAFADIEQRMLHEMRYQPRIGAVREYGRGAVPGRIFPVQRQRRLAQRVIGTLLRRCTSVGVAPRPRLDTGINIHRALLLAERNQGN